MLRFISFFIILISNAYASDIFNDAIIESIKPIEPVYKLNIDNLFLASIQKSYKVNAQLYALKSENKLYDAAKYYYIPTASLTSEIKKKFNRPGHPSPFTEFKLDLAANMKLWSNATGEQKDAAYYSLISSKELYNDLINEIYSNINQNIIKIELARAFLNNAEQYRKRMNILLDKMNISSKSGILKKSDRLFADVSIKKFEESILNVKSQIEQYKNQINNITPENLYDDGYGVSISYIEEAIDLNETMFKIKNVVKHNFGIRSKKAQLESDKYSTEGYSENFIVELVTQHDIKEHAKSNTKNDQNQAIYGYTYDNDGQSYLGLKVSFTGLNYKNYKEKASEYDLYNKKLIELDEAIHQTYVDLNTFNQQYYLIKQRISNVDKQINLTIDVINSMIKEMMVDESNILDIFRNISSLSDLEMNRLNIRNELVDLSIKVKSINSIIPSQYVIN